MFQTSPDEYEAYQRERATACPVRALGAEFKPFDVAYLPNTRTFFINALERVERQFIAFLPKISR